MIAFVHGTVCGIEESKVEVDTGCLGYEINVPSGVTAGFSIGQEIHLYTHLNVKEDEMSLFGFPSRDELHMFRLLITVNGIGPKGALAVLSALSPADLRFAILAGDAKTLSKAPGIGAKTAQRICLDLKDKVCLEDGLQALNTGIGKTPAGGDLSAKGEAITALTVLGYSSSEALRAVNLVDPNGKDTEEILKEALRYIGN